jgi:predicted nucleotidyltransferase component of viral defense system
MAFNESYRRQVALLLRTMPFIAQEASFALKGGTAINLFVRDLPRLSVDIDLTYLPLLPRARSLGAIDKAMQRIAGRVAKAIKGSRVTQGNTEGAVNKLFVRDGGVQIKIEVTPVMRGCAYAAELRGVSPAVEAAFGFAEMKVLSFADLYAGKIVAAFDRQHPRDLFDIRDLLANEGIDDRLRAAFIVYLLSHNRPMAEVLAVRPKDISAEFVAGFQGMTAQPVTVEELIAALALTRTAGAEPLDFGPDLSRSGWVVLSFPGIPSASFKAIDRSALEVSTDASAGLLWRTVGDGLRHGRLASWRWMVTEGVFPTDLTMRGVDDPALGVYFVFGTAADATKSPLALLGSPSVTALVYVFGGDKPRLDVTQPPHGSAREIYRASPSGCEQGLLVR